MKLEWGYSGHSNWISSGKLSSIQTFLHLFRFFFFFLFSKKGRFFTHLARIHFGWTVWEKESTRSRLALSISSTWGGPRQRFRSRYQLRNGQEYSHKSIYDHTQHPKAFKNQFSSTFSKFLGVSIRTDKFLLFSELEIYCNGNFLDKITMYSILVDFLLHIWWLCPVLTVSEEPWHRAPPVEHGCRCASSAFCDHISTRICRRCPCQPCHRGPWVGFPQRLRIDNACPRHGSWVTLTLLTILSSKIHLEADDVIRYFQRIKYQNKKANCGSRLLWAHPLPLLLTHSKTKLFTKIDFGNSG